MAQALRKYVDRCIRESLDGWIGGAVEWWIGGSADMGIGTPNRQICGLADRRYPTRTQGGFEPRRSDSRRRQQTNTVPIRPHGVVQAPREWVDRCIGESPESWIGGAVEWWVGGSADMRIGTPSRQICGLADRRLAKQNTGGLEPRHEDTRSRQQTNTLPITPQGWFRRLGDGWDDVSANR